MELNKKAYLVNGVAIAALYILLYCLIKTGIVNGYYERILILAGINIILVVSLNLVTGFLGQLVLGHAGFMAIGAYAAALTTLHTHFPIQIQLLISLLVGGIAAGFFGILIGIPALRLKGDYLGIITLGFGEVIRVFIFNMKFTGGARGLRGIPQLTTFNIVFWVTTIVVILAFTLIRSRHGRAILSICEDEIAAEAVGISTTYYKIFAFVIAAFLAGIAGGLLAHNMFIIDPKKFNFIYSVEMMVMVVFGGMGSITGSVLSASVLTVLPEILRQFSDYRMLTYSGLLIIMMLFRPEGLLGRREFSLVRPSSTMVRYVRKFTSKPHTML